MNDNWLCPRCKKRERENIDGDWMWYCGPCNDRDYERYRERQEWEHYHSDDDRGGLVGSPPDERGEA